MTSPHSALTMFMIAVFAAFAPARADEVLLKDGSRILGEVKELADGKLTITTGFAGDVQIDITQVIGITTNKAVNAQADSGDRAVGPLQYNPQVGQTVVTDPVGRVNLNIDRVTAIWPEGEPSPQEKAQAAELEKLKRPWSGKVGIGINGETGNTDRVSLNSDVSAKRDTGNERLKLHVHSRYTKENGEESTNEVFGGVNLEKDIDEKWYTFGNLDLEFDRQEQLDLRAKVTLGGGYFVVREEDHEFKVHGGAGYQHESFDDGSSEDQAILELGYDLSTQLSPNFLLNHYTTYFPSLERLDDYRLVSEVSAEVPLDESGLSLNLGVRNTYDGSPAEDARRLDVFYFLNVAWKWKE